MFRPLDILIHEIFTHEAGNPNLERYSAMMCDIHHLLVYVCSTMTQQRNNIDLRAINLTSRMDNDVEINYTLPLDEFQQTLVQQTTARKATGEATVICKQSRFNHSPFNSDSPFNGSNPSFFREGPPSQQGGFSNSNSTSTTTTTNLNEITSIYRDNWITNYIY